MNIILVSPYVHFFFWHGSPLPGPDCRHSVPVQRAGGGLALARGKGGHENPDDPLSQSSMCRLGPERVDDLPAVKERFARDGLLRVCFVFIFQLFEHADLATP
jgi:hypothetical protein